MDKMCDILTKIDELIPDDNLKKIIFNFQNNDNNLLADNEIVYRYFYNSMMFVSMLLYKIFTLWKEAVVEQGNDKFTNSMNRIFNLLDGCYDIKRINFDFIENLIINLQIDDRLSENSSSSTFLSSMELNDFFDLTNVDITKYFYDVKIKRLSSRCGIRFNYDDFFNVLKMLPVLRNIKVEFENFNENISNRYKKVIVTLNNYVPSYLSNGVIDLDKLMCVVLQRNGWGDCYILEDFSFENALKFKKDNEGKHQVTTLHYAPFSNSVEKRIVLVNNQEKLTSLKHSGCEDEIICENSAIENFFINHDIIVNTNLSERSLIFKDYTAFNNKYIKNMALTISDAIDEETKKAILDKYKKKEKYKEIFSGLKISSFYKSNELQRYRWDEIIIYLLVEEGVFDFLVFVLNHGYGNYERIVDHIGLRFKDGKGVFYNTAEDLKVKSKYQLHTTKKNLAKVQASTLILLATKLSALNDIKFAESYCTTDIADIISDMNEIHSKEDYIDIDKISYYLNAFIRISLFLDGFYEGLIAYGEKKKFIEWNEERTKKDTTFKNELDETALEQFSKLLKEHKAKTIEYNNLSGFNVSNPNFFENAKNIVNDIFTLLISRNMMVSKRNSRSNEAVFHMIGKRQIFNNDEIETYRKKILKSLEICTDIDNINYRNIENDLYESVNSYFRYLKGGSEGFDVIYPILGTCSQGIISRDGYRYSYIIANSGNENQPNRIKAIIDEDFRVGHMYYCLPNFDRMAYCDNEYVWVNPVIIPLKYCFSNIETQQISKLSLPEDYEQASELIYETDTSIYSNLFGSLENAKKVLPILFEKKNSIFYKDNYYIVKSNGVVVAIASIYNDDPSQTLEWEPTIFEMIMEEKGIEITDSMRKSYDYFDDTFNDRIGEDFLVICDLCVKQEYRNRGLAKWLLTKLINKAANKGKTLLISVYSNNAVALRLYNSMGFIRYFDGIDTRGTAQRDKTYYKMVKFT